MDFDKATNIADLIKPFLGILSNKYREPEVNQDEVKIRVTGSTATFIPVGLPNDKQLSELGIQRHTVEDFIIKLICVDKKVQKWTGVTPEQLRTCAKGIKDEAHLDSSKTLLMALGVIKGGKTIEELIPEAVEQADPESPSKVCTPLTSRLFK